MTESQAQFLRAVAPRPGGKEGLESRVRKALGNDIADRWVSAFCDLLKILGDREDAVDDGLSIADIKREQVESMRRNWNDAEDDGPQKRIVQLRSVYDWPALVATINVCPEPGQDH